MNTVYTLAVLDKDIAAAKRYLRRIGEKRPDPKHPTILVKRGKKHVGCLATSYINSRVVAHPFHCELERPVRVMVKMLDFYEKLLIQAGVSEYLLAVKAPDTRWRAIVEKLGYILYHRDANGSLYRRVF